MEKETKKKTTNKKNSSGKSTTKKTVAKKPAKKKEVVTNTTKVSNTTKNDKSSSKKSEKKLETKKETVKKKEVVLEKEVNVHEPKKEFIKPKEQKMAMSDNEITRIFKIILIVAGILLALYFLTFFILNKDGKNKKEDETKKPTIQYEEIIASRIFNQSSSDYYVLVYTDDDKFINSYNTYLNIYKYKENSSKVYKVNMDSDFNSYIIGEENNIYVGNSKELKLVQTTLLKISNGSVVEAYQGKDDIINYLKGISG